MSKRILIFYHLIGLYALWSRLPPVPFCQENKDVWSAKRPKLLSHHPTLTNPAQDLRDVLFDLWIKCNFKWSRILRPYLSRLNKRFKILSRCKPKVLISSPAWTAWQFLSKTRTDHKKTPRSIKIHVGSCCVMLHHFVHFQAIDLYRSIHTNCYLYLIYIMTWQSYPKR